MAGFRAIGSRSGGMPDSKVMPGDTFLGGEAVAPGTIITAGAGTLTGAAIASGIILRSDGGGAGFTDTTDTSENILAALSGSGNPADVAPGSTFRLTYVNNVAFAMTFARGVGVVAGVGTLDTAASKVHEYLITVMNNSPSVTVQSNTTNASKVVTFVLPPGSAALNIGPNPPQYNITPGMLVTGTGITAGTLVASVDQGQGGITGIHLDTNATATSASGGVALVFHPVIKFDSLYTGTQ
jgi:hypothetical protein